MPQPSRAFISYSHDSPEHQARVLRFATRLVTEGIDARLDQWVDDPDGGWPFWMERQIADSDFVILVCTPTYRQRVEQTRQEQGGAGVFWEANIIRNRLYNAKGGSRHFIPVFFETSGREQIPEILQGATSYQIDTPEGYTALYRRLTGQPATQRPELGNLIVLPRNSLLDDKARDAAKPGENEFSLPSPLSFTSLRPLDHCDESQLKSLDGSIATVIRFDNYLQEDVILYWLNYDGVRVNYGALEAGRSRIQQTYVTHPWVVAAKAVDAGAAKCVAIFQPAAEPGVAQIDPASIAVSTNQ